MRPVLLSTVPSTSNIVGTAHRKATRREVRSGEPSARVTDGSAALLRSSRCCCRHQMGHASSWPMKQKRPW